MWIVEVPDQRPSRDGHPPWKRLRRLQPETPAGDVSAYLRELLGLHTAARATLGNVEVAATRRCTWSKRMLAVQP